MTDECKHCQELQSHIDKLTGIFDAAYPCHDDCCLAGILAWVDPADLQRVRELTHTWKYALQQIREWDMLNPVEGKKEPLADGPWLRDLIDKALNAIPAKKEHPLTPILERASQEVAGWPDWKMSQDIKDELRKLGK